jgi:hypothetical protein
MKRQRETEIDFPENELSRDRTVQEVRENVYPRKEW